MEQKFRDAGTLSTYEARIALSLAREMAEDPKVSEFFRERGCNEMLEILGRWRKLGQEAWMLENCRAVLGPENVGFVVGVCPAIMGSSIFQTRHT